MRAPIALTARPTATAPLGESGVALTRPGRR